MKGIPAATLLPPAFDKGTKYTWSLRDIPEDGSRRLYLCSELHAGWRYFTENREIRLSKEYPRDYGADIGFKYGHGPDKGPDKQERDKPGEIWMARAWIVEDERMAVAIFDSYTVRSQIQKLLASNDEYMMLPNGVCNFYLQIFRDSKPSSPSATYLTQSSLRPTRSKPCIEASAQPWYPDSYWQGLNPLEEPASPPSVPTLPTTVRDENGADLEVSIKQATGDEEPTAQEDW